MMLIAYTRWVGTHSLGRFAREVVARLPEGQVLPGMLPLLPPLDPLWLSWLLLPESARDFVGYLMSSVWEAVHTWKTLVDSLPLDGIHLTSAVARLVSLIGSVLAVQIYLPIGAGTFIYKDVPYAITGLHHGVAQRTFLDLAPIGVEFGLLARIILAA